MASAGQRLSPESSHRYSRTTHCASRLVWSSLVGAALSFTKRFQFQMVRQMLCVSLSLDGVIICKFVNVCKFYYCKVNNLFIILENLLNQLQ